MSSSASNKRSTSRAACEQLCGNSAPARARRAPKIGVMNPILGWLLAAALLVSAYLSYGWHGVALAATVIVFWLLLQFSRALRVMKSATDKPVGHVDSAVMLNARLRNRMTMMQVVPLAKSLGRQVSVEPEVWAWTDDSGATVATTWSRGRLEGWTLTRPDEDAP